MDASEAAGPQVVEKIADQQINLTIGEKPDCSHYEQQLKSEMEILVGM